MRNIIAFAFLSMSPLPALAQSAEETVIYMLNGIVNERVDMGGDPATNSPAIAMRPISGGKLGTEVFLAMDPKVVVQRLEYAKVDNCKYNVTVQVIADNGQGLREIGTLELDWSKASSIELQQNKREKSSNVKVAGLTVSSCTSTIPTACKEMGTEPPSTILKSVGDQERASKALVYFKDKYCKGSAF